MDGKPSLVALGGFGLIFANLWTGPQKQTLKDLASLDFGGHSTEFKQLGIELLTVIVLTYLANVSDTAANTVLVILLTLWVLWAIKHFATKAAPAAKPTAL